MRIAEVFLPLPVKKPFSYIVPDYFRDKVRKGVRVVVEIKGRRVVGVVKNVKEYEEGSSDALFSGTEYKPIQDVLDDIVVYREDMEPLIEFIAHRTFTSPGEVLYAMAPPSIRKPRKKLPDEKTYFSKVIRRFKRYQDKKVRFNLPEPFEEKILNNFKRSAFFGFYTGGFARRVQFFWEIYKRFWEVMKIPPKFLVLLPTETHLENFMLPSWLPENTRLVTFPVKASSSHFYISLKQILSGEFDGVVGLRRASILPYPPGSLDLIFIMEEGDESYRAPRIPKYDAVVVGMFQGKLHSAQVFLSDVVPSVRSYYMIKKKEFSAVLVSKSEKLNISVVEIEHSTIPIGKGYLHTRTFSEIQNAFERGKKILILVPRRGYSYLKCRNCGYIPKCPRCGVPLRYHQDEKVLKCHYCGYRTSDMLCPKCGQGFFEYVSFGDEHVEGLLSRFFGSKNVAIYDEDNIPAKVPGVLIATLKIIPKLADFEFASQFGLAVVLFGDIFLSFPDYALDEKFYRLMSLLSKDLPRSEKTIIEVRNKFNFEMSFPNPSSVKETLEKLLTERNKGGEIEGEAVFPPFAQLVLLAVRDENIERLERETRKIVAELEKLKGVINVVDYPPMVTKIRGKHRRFVLVKVRSHKDVYETILKLRSGNVSVELNPRNLNR